MAALTKKERSAAAKKAARTRKKNESKAESADRDKSHALGKKKVKTRAGEVPPHVEPTVEPEQTITIRPEQTPRKRDGLEEPDSDQARGDDLSPADRDNPIARGDIKDPLAKKGD